MNPNKSARFGAKQVVTVCKAVSATVILLLAIIGAIAFSSHFDPQGRYFLSTALPTALYVLIGATIAFAIATIFLLRGNEVSEKNSFLYRGTSALTAVSSLIPFIYYIYRYFEGKFAPLFTLPTQASGSEGGIDYLAIAIVITALLSLIYAVSCIVELNKALTLFVGYGRVFFLALIITKLYLDFSVELNSPVKLLVQFAAATAMLSTLADLKVTVGRPTLSSFFPFKLISAALGVLCAVAFVFEIAPNPSKYGFDLIMFAAVTLAFGIESCVQLFAFKLKSDEIRTPNSGIQIGVNDETAIEINEAKANDANLGETKISETDNGENSAQ